MNNYNLVFEDENCYGFLPDIIRMFEDSAKNDPNDEIVKDALEEAKKIYSEDDDYPQSIYKCEYCAMGAYLFRKLVKEN